MAQLTASPVKGARVYPTRDDMQRAASGFVRTVDHWRGEEGPRTHLTLAAGMWRLWDRDLHRWEQRLERVQQARKIEVDLEVALGSDGDNRSMAATGRGAITGWSAKSRNRMKQAFASADWSQVFDGTRDAAMVTLTMPHDWVPLAPTARDFKRLVDRWQAAFSKAWGARPAGGWKMEFQGRWDCRTDSCNAATRPPGDRHDPRAPHLHILMTIPEGAPATNTVSKATGEVATDFRSWLSISWAKACRTREVLGVEVAAQHERAGTGVDVDETIRYGDPLRIAQYFEKHGAGSAKAYQNEMPDAWNVAELGGANFWGLWGDVRRNKAVAVVEVDARVGDQLARTARRASRAEGVIVEREVWRGAPLPATMLAQLRDAAAKLYGDEGGFVALPGGAESFDALRVRIKTLIALISEEDAERLLGALRAEDGRWRRVWLDRDGELRIHRRRRVRRRVTRMQRSRGFVMVNDGISTAAQLARLVEHFGAERGLLDRDEYAETAAAEASRRRLLALAA